MPGDPKSKEWNLLKDHFDALVHDESVREDSIETFFDDQIRRRFGEWITRARERKNRTADSSSEGNTRAVSSMFRVGRFVQQGVENLVGRCVVVALARP